jgi:hypothetical protein
MTAESPATVADVLRRAAQIHAERGGCKGRFKDGDGRVCMWGAIEAAVDEQSQTVATMITERQIEQAMQRRFATSAPYPGVDWNDLPATTDLDVQKVLLRAADDAEFSS